MKISPPAFPTWIADDSMALGMTLRDYFAAAAIDALLKYDLPLSKEHQEGMEWIAKTSYALADKMMKARDQ